MNYGLYLDQCLSIIVPGILNIWHDASHGLVTFRLYNPLYLSTWYYLVYSTSCVVYVACFTPGLAKMHFITIYIWVYNIQ